MLPALTVLRLLLGAIVYHRGFPYFGSGLVANAALWEAPVAGFHWPGVTVLTLSGHCCGMGRGLILGPSIKGGHVPVTAMGVLILVATNWLVWLVLATLGSAAWHLRPSGRSAATPTEPSGPT
jgi:hypothetical protein